jgi:hypothetical protein
MSFSYTIFYRHKISEGCLGIEHGGKYLDVKQRK